MDSGDRKKLYQIQALVDSIETEKELYNKTENLHIEGKRGPVTADLASYKLPPLDCLLELWNELTDLNRENRSMDEGLYDDRSFTEKYREIEERIEGSREFLEDVYSLEKPLHSLKIEKRYEQYN